mmetsp:Transcript_4944/g.7055  ORF Transcript_4944/g.7055 Transcript_4944/m.7055 type:complete len:641 (+) Transcript_4944:33-1955(+)
MSSDLKQKSIHDDPICIAKEWLIDDPNPHTSELIQSLINSNDSNELRTYFNTGRIGFGTAGLRAKMMPGPHGMNDLVVIQASQGLAKCCLKYHAQENIEKDGSSSSNSRPKAVIGYDHRSNPSLQLSSLHFAVLTKVAFEHAGIDCVLLDGYVATPLVAFSVTAIPNCVCGVMVTASHNPKDDAGYKVYWKDGCQIRPPIDKEIAESIESNLKPWIDYGKLVQVLKEKNTAEHSDGEQQQQQQQTLGLSNVSETQHLADEYYAAISRSGLIRNFEDSRIKFQQHPPGIAYTAMHGVGTPWTKRSFETFGLPKFTCVPSQEYPDPEFPTVPFPNPEEKGALSEAMTFSESQGLDVILANDPDADRLSVAERCRHTGKWTVFTGDQIGTMLGHWIWEIEGKSSDKPVAMCASTVSSKMLAAIAAAEGFRFEDTLTGFKWIGSRSLELRNEGYRVLFACEEAIGFCCGEFVADKDGVTAAAVFAQLTLRIYQRGSSIASHMQSLYNKYGEFVSNNGYFFCYDTSIAEKIFDAIRNAGRYMESVGGYEVCAIRDLGEPGYDSTTSDKKPTLPTNKASPMITIKFKNGCVAQFRSSGTEPKFKYYIELHGKAGIPRADVQAELEIMSGVLLEELLNPSENGLVKP